MTSAASLRRLKKLVSLPLVEKLALVEAAACLPVAWVGLRTAGLRALRGLTFQVDPDDRRSISPDEVARLGRLVAIAAQHGPFRATCLPRSVVLGWMLRRRGVASELRIGVRLEQGALRGHAWIEHGGVPINESADVRERFAAFHGTPAAAAVDFG